MCNTTDYIWENWFFDLTCDLHLYYLSYKCYRCYINETHCIWTKGYRDKCPSGRFLFFPPIFYKTYLTEPFYVVQLSLSPDELCSFATIPQMLPDSRTPACWVVWTACSRSPASGRTRSIGWSGSRSCRWGRGTGSCRSSCHAHRTRPPIDR